MAYSQLREPTAAATAYEDLFVPALFRQWTDPILDAARVQPHYRVLDVACGTGVLARQAASRVAGRGWVAGLDLNPDMLAVAMRIAPGISWCQGSAELLPFEERSFDAVVCQFGLMFFSDRRQALREMTRVLSSGGSLTVAVWNSVDKIPAYAAEVALVERLAGERAAEALRAPFALGDPIQLKALAESAGVGSVEVATVPGVAQFPSIRSMIEADVRGWLPLMGVDLTEDQIQRILEQAEDVFRPYVTTGGGMEFELSAHLVTGTK